jgi:hypothetical protein
MRKTVRFLPQTMLTLVAGAWLGYLAAHLPAHYVTANDSTGGPALAAPAAARAVNSNAVDSGAVNSVGGEIACDGPVQTTAATIAAHNQLVAATAAQTGRKPNICIIWGDDVGQSNISSYDLAKHTLNRGAHRLARIKQNVIFAPIQRRNDESFLAKL